jgi:hypothetical protein
MGAVVPVKRKADNHTLVTKANKMEGHQWGQFYMEDKIFYLKKKLYFKIIRN